MSSFSESDLKTVHEILRRAAESEVLRRFRRLGPGDIRHKSSDIDLVTEADEAAERAIRQDLSASFTTAAIVGEEQAAADPGCLRTIGEHALCFLVDPIDGTKNYASSLPLFGMMISVLASGQTIAGVIYDPISDDAALAIRGSGAWIVRADGARSQLRVGPPHPLARMQGIVAWHFMEEPLRSTVAENCAKVAVATSYRCAAHEYRLAAAGHLDFIVHGKIMPWDEAAGVLLYEEAGGYAAHFDGSAYAPQRTSGGVICSPDLATWHTLREALIGPLSSVQK